MEQIPEKFLPVGTVVLLKDAEKRLMITGFCITENGKEDVVWDYCGCLYPEGDIEANKNYLFNHEQIDKVFHLGLVDEEEEQFKKALSVALNKE